MRPTSRALQVAPLIQEALLQVRSALAEGARFVPETDRRQFRLGGGDHADLAVGLPLVALLRKQAPATTLKIVMVNRESALQMLDEGDLDLVIAAFREWPKRIKSTSLYSEKFVSLAQRGHAGFSKGPPSLQEFLELPHLRVAVPGSRDLFDAALADRNLRRRVVSTVPNFAGVPYVVQETDLVAVIGERIALRFAEELDVAVHPIPLQVAPCALRMYWSAHAENEPASIWLRERLREVGALLSREKNCASTVVARAKGTAQ